MLSKKAELVAEQEGITAFDVAHAPLFRVRVFRVGVEAYLLLLVVHHVIVDGWSVEVLMEELAEHYSALCVRGDALVARPALQFLDFARWQRQWAATAPAKGQIDYWKERLRGATPVFAEKRRRGRARIALFRAEERVEFSKELSTSLAILSKERRVTLFVTLLTGFQALLTARCAREDTCVAIAGANRIRNGTERMIGPLVNTLLVRTRLNGDISFDQALELVQQSVLEAIDRQKVPFDA